jgi:hypothetical protein
MVLPAGPLALCLVSPFISGTSSFLALTSSGPPQVRQDLAAGILLDPHLGHRIMTCPQDVWGFYSDTLEMNRAF